MVYLDGLAHKLNNQITIFQFCANTGINLPCFCYHEKLSIAGNCRMCIVQVNNVLVVSCAVTLLKDMIIFTEIKRVRYARESILELLLINHPLDCPICDQGGECDLQDISMIYGTDRGRFHEHQKRSVVNLNNCGPLIKTVMTRCIHCSRCIRFLNEICGINSLGLLGRGLSMEVGSYIDKFINTELSGNIIDLCPVGALTSMPFAFKARPWELIKVYSIDILDSMASSVRLDVRNNLIMRIVPSLNEEINEE
jgi:NADH dehydrogenase/NADH:ubiquinone oxidoreductase subunit G